MVDPIVVVGAGGFGRETVDVIQAINDASASQVWELAGVVDDNPSELSLQRLESRGIEHLGGLDDLIAHPDRPAYVVGIGSPAIRKKIADRLDAVGFQPATLVHPDATVGSACAIGEGTVILAGARLTTNIALGRHVHLNPNATVGHDTVLRDFVSMNPSSSVSGDCVVGEGALIGVHAVVLNQRQIGAWAVVGAAACVVKNVSERAVVVGVPAVERERTA